MTHLSEMIKKHDHTWTHMENMVKLAMRRTVNISTQLH